jgi:hypothetical protein
MQIVLDGRGLWLVFDADGKFIDGPYADYRTAKTAAEKAKSRQELAWAATCI